MRFFTDHSELDALMKEYERSKRIRKRAQRNTRNKKSKSLSEQEAGLLAEDIYEEKS